MPSPNSTPFARKRPAENAESALEFGQQATDKAQKRPRIEAYQSTNQESGPLSGKRKAASQDLNEDRSENDEWYEGSSSSDTDQNAPNEGKKRARLDGVADAASPLDDPTGSSSTQTQQATVFDPTDEELDQELLDVIDQMVAERKATGQNPGRAGEDDLLEGTDRQEEEVVEDHDEKNEDQSIPVSPPAAAFNLQPPAKVASWTRGCYPPTRPYANLNDSPINWTYIKNCSNLLTDAQILAYDLRKPWAPKGQEVHYERIIELLHGFGDFSVDTLEGIRKRFKKANLAVFENTGVWFEGSTPGLEVFGLKGRTKAELLRDHKLQNDGAEDDDEANTLAPSPAKEELPAGEPIIEFLLQPQDFEVGDRCVECCENTKCYDKKCREAWKRFQKSASGYSDSSDGSDQEWTDPQDEVEPYHAGSHSKDRWVQALAKQHAPFGCLEHQPETKRWIHLPRFQAFHVSRAPIDNLYILDVSPMAFDLFASCLAPNANGEFPGQWERLTLYRDYEDETNGVDYTKAIYEDFEDSFTIGDFLEAYCCSQSLECPAVSDIILSQLWKMLKDYESINVFRPDDINYVFHYTHASDPMRLFLLDAFQLKMPDATSMMKRHRQEYPPELVRYWDHWYRQQHAVLSPDSQRKVDRFVSGRYKGHRGAASGLIGVMRILFKDAENPERAIFDCWSFANRQPCMDWLSREALHARFTQSDSVEALSATSEELFKQTYYNQYSGARQKM